MTRHEFLAALHELLRPKVYLEVGVQYGTSLALAAYSDVAIGIDPHPLINESGNQVLYQMTSDEFFSRRSDVMSMPRREIDLAFIDGSHLAEDALHDFINIREYCGPRSVVVFDDMLPYSQEIAARVQPPGDWTGDVWKVFYAIQEEYDDCCLNFFLVDTFPTGLLVVWGFYDHNGTPEIGDYPTDEVPDEIINRTRAHQPEEILAYIKEQLCASPSPEGEGSLEPPPSSEH